MKRSRFTEDQIIGILKEHESGVDSFDGEMADLLIGILRAYETDGEGELATKKLGQFLTARYSIVSESKGKLGELATARRIQAHADHAVCGLNWVSAPTPLHFPLGCRLV